MKPPRPPADLKTAGKLLWNAIAADYEIRGTEFLLAELCRLSDRLSEIRAILERDGLTIGKDARKHPLADLEPKLSAQFQKVWRMLGLADSDQQKRPVGRPSDSDRRLGIA